VLTPAQIQSIFAPQYFIPQYYNPQLLQMVKLTQHDSAVAGKLFNPITDQHESLENIWKKSLTNAIRLCSVGLTKFRKPFEKIKGNNTVFFIKPLEVLLAAN